MGLSLKNPVKQMRDATKKLSGGQRFALSALVPTALETIGTTMLHDTKKRKENTRGKVINWQKSRQTIVPLAAAVATWYAGGYGGMAAGAQMSAATTVGSGVQQGMAASEAVKQGEIAEFKLKKRRRAESSRLAQMAYNESFMGGTRSMLKSRGTGGKATVG